MAQDGNQVQLAHAYGHIHVRSVTTVIPGFHKQFLFAPV